MLAATRISSLLNLFPRSEDDRVNAVISRFGPLPPVGDLTPDRLLVTMGRDKKTVAGTLHFVLPTSIGNVKIVNNVPEPIVRQALVETLQ